MKQIYSIFNFKRRDKYSIALFLFFTAIISYGQQTLGTAIDLSSYISIGSYNTGTINTSDGETITGVGAGACNQIPCCSTYVYYIKPTIDVHVRVENDNFTSLAGFIMAYESDVEATDFSDLTYIQELGNFCGYRDTLQLGKTRKFNRYKDAIHVSEDAPSSSNFLEKDKYYYFFVNNYNNQISRGAPSSFEFEFVPECPEGFTCEFYSETICGADSYTSPSGAVYTEAGSYEETIGTVKKYYNVAFKRTDAVQDFIADETLAESKDYTVITHKVSYLDFDKSSSRYATLDNLQDDLEGTNRSVFMWVKKHTNVASSGQVLFGINSSSGGNVCNLQISTSEKIQVYDGSNSRGNSISIDNDWHYVGYTYDATTHETKIYMDGVLKHTYTNNQLTTATSVYSLGQEYDSGLSTGNYFDGYMTEVSVWNEVLSETDIATAMASKITATHPKYANLKGYYSFPSCADGETELKDWSGNGNDGVLVNLERPITTTEAIATFDSSDWFTYSWLKDDVEFATTKTATVDNVGNYTGVFTRDYLQLTEEFVIDGTVLSAEQARLAKEPRLSIYPNPVNDVLKIAIANQELEFVSIKNAQGQELLRASQKEVSTAHLKSGVYFVQVKTNKSQSVFKVVKQ